MTKPKEPTLTCSEVVERLAQIAEEQFTWRDDHGERHGHAIAEAIRKQAPQILAEWLKQVGGGEVEVGRGVQQTKSSTGIEPPSAHSWRERRVQELEGCLLGLSLTLEKLVLPRIVDALKDFDNPQMVGIVHKKDLYWLPLAQGHLESSIKEIQRTLANSEQIRKGAKHE